MGRTRAGETLRYLPDIEVLEDARLLSRKDFDMKPYAAAEDETDTESIE